MSIDAAMYFALGCLVAGLVALVVMTSLWRRAVRLTTRRLEAMLPFDAETVRVEMDQRAARTARDLRRFELALADLRRANADERITVGRQRVALDGLGADLERARARAGAAEARVGELEALVRARDVDVATLEHEAEVARARIGDLDRAVADSEQTIADLHRDLDERRVEGATRATMIEALEVRLRKARQDVAERGGRLDEFGAALKQAEAAVARERGRADRFEQRIDRLVGDVADREETSMRRQRELDRAREALAVAQRRLAERWGEPDAETGGDNMVRAMEDLEAQNHALAARLEEVTRERDRLAAVDRPQMAGLPAGEAGRAVLRDQIADLAARMVRLSGRLEGGVAGLAEAEDGGGPRPSLADRIRALEGRTEPRTGETAM